MLSRGVGEGGLGDVDGLVDDASLLADGFGQEDAGFGCGTCTELDEGEHRGDPVGGWGSFGG